MSEDLSALETWAAELLAKMEEGERRGLARKIAVDLRRSQSQRIAAQQNPDGSGFAPRKGQALRGKVGRIKRKAAMFPKLRRPTFLRTESSADEVAVGFKNATVARVARVHQEGLRDRVSRRKGSPEVTYPARVLLGFTDEDRGRMLDLIVKHLEA